ncbi:putative 1-phosphatidylinositol-3-phosphate 5-kinase FAB1C [Ziziphus jujuba]|uniref:1-phosphatidylinositol-3-phosphate 5-kinase n=1 Tax=Ziziphus jujuba TaxID=326968 RepID=A0A6P3ZP33_ZIZJJ|nr:putative 1-phosphatidylinositol-3-phosphate 5-kinase FAB1C [Ziziphus jujuba]
MGIPDSSLLDLIEKVRSWISWGRRDLQCLSGGFEMPDNCSKMCCECHTNFTNTCHRFHCQSCGQWFCGKCIPHHGLDSLKGNAEGEESIIKFCKLCSEISLRKECERKYGEKVHPSVSPRESPEPPSPSFSGERIKCSADGESIQSDHFARYIEARDYGYYPHAMTSGSMSSFSAHPSPVHVRRSSSRSDDEEAEDSGKHFYSPSSEYFHDNSDVDSSSVSARNEFYNFKSVGSSPYDSPSRIDFTSSRVGHCVQKWQGESPVSRNDGSNGQETMAILKKPDIGTEDPDNNDDYTDDLSVFRSQYEKSQRPLDFENNGLIWFPPPPEDENDEVESGFFTYDDEDDEIGDSRAVFSSSSSLPSMFPAKEKQNEGNKEPLRAVVQGHFRALVSQLLQGEGIKIGKENGDEDWLDIVTTIAWQAANFVKPDTSKGGSMDPLDYIKVKCIASGNPSDSTLIKGVVCTKNIKHKRMTSQYKNPRLLILGGALEYQRVPNKLASFNTLLHQENDHLKMIISKIEALRPNVLLVEKSVSSYAQDYLLAKEISLVLNVKRPLLERIAQCTGALITQSVDNISTTRLGHCELFRLEKICEQHETANQFNKKPSKTLMFFEGCPRRLGCTVLLKGASREELKKVKHVVQYAVFAAYHLSLETSFLADEGATLPKMTQGGHPIAIPERVTADFSISAIPDSLAPTNSEVAADGYAQDEETLILNPEREGSELLSGHFGPGYGFSLSSRSIDCVDGSAFFTISHLASNMGFDSSPNQFKDIKQSTALPSNIRKFSQSEFPELSAPEESRPEDIHELTKSERIDENDVSSEYFSSADTQQSILVSLSSRCVLKGTVCERSRLMRIKFYGRFDKPLGMYLRDDLFDQAIYCRSCNEPAEAHVICYTHQQGNLTINVKRLPSLKLPGERDGKIWMWHRCLRCTHVDGVPPATRRVVMSDAAWGLSFGKFLELSFSNHATANRIATCGHSLQRDCLRYYGLGSMVAFFRYSPIDILSVHLPPSVLEFNGCGQPEWIRREATEIMGKMETLYAEISDILDSMEDKTRFLGQESSDTTDLQNHVLEMKDLVKRERVDFIGILQPAIIETSQPGQMAVDILELNRLRCSLVIGSHVWDRRLYSMNSLLKRNSISKATQPDASFVHHKELMSDSLSKDGRVDYGQEEIACESLKLHESTENGILSEQKEPVVSPCEPYVPEDSTVSCHQNRQEEFSSDGEITVIRASFESFPSHESTLSDKIDSAWTGTDQLLMKAQPVHVSNADGSQAATVRQTFQSDYPPFRRLRLPGRVHSFDSALRVQDRVRKGLPPSSLHLSNLRSFHASGDYRSMVRDPLSNVTRTFSQTLPLEAQKMNLLLSSTPTLISSASQMAEGVRLLLPQTGQSDIVIAVYDNEPTSIISYALSCKEYDDWVADKPYEHEGGWSAHESGREDSAASTFSAWHSFGSIDLDYIHYGSYGTEDASSSMSSLFADTKKSPHLRISFGDESSTGGGKVKFSVTCYYAKQFDSLRKKCCPSEVDFVRSLSRCRRWSAQGGKSNVYFAKSLDERFIIKQVTKTELESFEEFAPQYFKYLTDSLSSGSPTCLAKVLGIYQVTVKHLKGGKETRMDLMVMENLFFKRSISKVYDLKGSARSRYNSDTTGVNKVLLDMNLLETLRTKPIFLGSKAKRSLERAIWNDTAFLASVDVMDYSLLVGVDDDRKELVLGIIDFMRQYTWDKHLETWVKASGILGGPRNASPTIISPKQYKKRFRKAMTTYFLTVPDQWSS